MHMVGKNRRIFVLIFILKSLYLWNRVPTAQGKLFKVIPDRENTGNLKILEKHREFENFRMILKSNSHLHSRAAGRDSQVKFDVLA